MGMAAGGNVGDNHGMFEPIHGSSPKHAGKDEVNPMAMVLAVQMMLEWLGRRRRERALAEAVAPGEGPVIAAPKAGNGAPDDLGGTAKCLQVGAAIVSRVT